MDRQKLRVGVLFGGRSCEHQVSLMSARSVMAAMDRQRFEVVPIGITQDGHWLHLANATGLTDDQPLPTQAGRAVSLLPEPGAQGLRVTASGEAIPFDVIFPLIHGTYGEDGTLQGLLELADIPYVGAGVLGSAVGMDKAVMKALFAHAGLPQAPYRVILRRDWYQDPYAVQTRCERALNYPLFIKPANLGSSVGISKVNRADEFAAAMQQAAQYDRKLIVEQGIEDAHEVEISVLGNDQPQVSVPGEIIPCHAFYDYAAKYLAGESRLLIPAPLPESVTARLQDYAVRAFQALDGAGLARIDCLVTRSDYQIFLIEANTLPGFTAISMYPKLWEASGLPYAQLIERLIEFALERHQERRQNQTRFLP